MNQSRFFMSFDLLLTHINFLTKEIFTNYDICYVYQFACLFDATCAFMIAFIDLEVRTYL